VYDVLLLLTCIGTVRGFALYAIADNIHGDISSSINGGHQQYVGKEGGDESTEEAEHKRRGELGLITAQDSYDSLYDSNSDGSDAGSDEERVEEGVEEVVVEEEEGGGAQVGGQAVEEGVKSWTGSTRVDYAEIWAVLQTRAPSGELVFDSKKLIGRGASCNVYKAELHGVMCAIKVLGSTLDEDTGEDMEESREEKQFAAEVDILTGIKHENVCSLYASSTNGDHKCAVLELMDTALENRLMDGGPCSYGDFRLVGAGDTPPLSWEQRVYITLCAFRGIIALHSRRPVQIHRDIKTSVSQPRVCGGRKCRGGGRGRKAERNGDV
jgi:hypothetical protein